jgi:nicotinamide phosphoribosyltransferase
MKKFINPMLMCDFYKVSHKNMYPEGTEYIYATWTPRVSRIAGINEVVAVGFQQFIEKYLIDFFNENFFDVNINVIKDDYKRLIKYTLGVDDADTAHIEDLHSLGYLPLEICAVPEGTCVPVRTPIMTISNTDKRFFWLTNYIETLASCELWQISTSATIAKEYRRIFDEFAFKTVGENSFVDFQGHDFSMRGMSSLDSAISSGMGHLFSFSGTDTIPAIQGMEYYYDANIENEMVGTSIPASEHSIQCSYENDTEYFNKLITEVHPSGFVSIVSDGYDFWNVISNIIPSLKDKIMSRDGKTIIRPDSGDPIDIICGDEESNDAYIRKGAVECLWDIFGGTLTEKGYKLLDSHIGLIYGDAITLERAETICKRLQEKGFASINVVYGIGSYTYQYNTRDTFGFALKTTWCKINGKEIKIFKDPKTDNGIKKSQKGLIKVFKENGEIKFIDDMTTEKYNSDEHKNLLQVVFKNSSMFNRQNFSDVKQRMKI